MKPLNYHPDALGELHEASLFYYEGGVPEKGNALVAELNAALAQISEHPRRWREAVLGSMIG